MELVDQSHGAVLPPTFGASLRAARLSRNVTLDAVAAHTKINRSFFQDLERNDLSKWPPNQFYRESYLRAYCEAIGLDAREVIDGFRRELSGADGSSADAPSVRPRRLTPLTIPIILAVTFVVFYSIARWLGPAAGQPDAAATTSGTPAPVEEPAAASAAPAPIEPASTPAGVTPAAPPAALVETPVIPERIEGQLTITSTPAGATVLVNGINRGTTPVQLQNLPAGSYAVRLIHAGHASVSQRVTISPARRNADVSVEMELEQPAPE